MPLKVVFFNRAHNWSRLNPIYRGELSSQSGDNCGRSWTIVDKYVRHPFAKLSISCSGGGLVISN